MSLATKPPPNALRLIFAMVLFTLAALLLVWVAATNEQGLIVFGFEFSQGGASAIYVMSAIWAAGVAGYAAFRLVTGR